MVECGHDGVEDTGAGDQTEHHQRIYLVFPDNVGHVAPDIQHGGSLL